MKFCVYVHTSPKGKRYVGQTCSVPQVRWGKNGSQYNTNKHFFAAITKYGWDNFTHSIVAEGLTQEEADALEKHLIQQYNSTDANYGYNHEGGGRTGPIASKRTRDKISKSLKGRKMKPHVKKLVSNTMKGNHHFLGKRHTEETKAKIGTAQKGKKVSEETLTKLRRKVICIETNQIFESINDAGIFVGSIKRAASITDCCRRRQKTAYGYHWEYV